MTRDSVAAEVEDGVILLRPKRLIRKGQEWFWTDAWQAAEREADADLRAGRVHRFKSADEAIAYLHQRVEGLKCVCSAKQTRGAPHPARFSSVYPFRRRQSADHAAFFNRTSSFKNTRFPFSTST